LKAFITSKDGDLNPALSSEELSAFRAAFTFLNDSYREQPDLLASKLATDQPQFYTLITTLLSTDLMAKFENDLPARLNFAARVLDGKQDPPAGLKKEVKVYGDMATKQTTNPDRRAKRQEILVRLVDEYVASDE
jgi:hypothetical protein